MAGSKPSEAVQNFLDPLQQSLSCVTKTVLQVSHGGYKPHKDPHWVAPGHGELIELAGPRWFFLDVKMHYRIIRLEDPTDPHGPWKVSTVSYLFAILAPPGEETLSQTPQEIISYHWKPGGSGRRGMPHVHIGAAALKENGSLAHKYHLPTGRVSLEEVLYFALDELGVKPEKQDDWRRILTENWQRFRDHRTWG